MGLLSLEPHQRETRLSEPSHRAWSLRLEQHRSASSGRTFGPSQPLKRLIRVLPFEPLIFGGTLDVSGGSFGLLGTYAPNPQLLSSIQCIPISNSGARVT